MDQMLRQFAGFIRSGVEAADVIRTAISPTWTDIGQLAAMSAIRAFLNHFFDKDLEAYGIPKSLSSIRWAPRYCVSAQPGTAMRTTYNA